SMIPGCSSGLPYTALFRSGSVDPITLSVTVTTAAGCARNGSQAITVNPLPSCTIAGPNGACANSTGNTFTGPLGMAGYTWSISGNGRTPGSTSGQSVSVSA